MKKTIIALDPVKHEPIVREMTDQERPLYYFGESVGILLFQPWYYCIPTPGHVAFAPTYNFPVRFKFVNDPFDPAGFHESSPENKGWNIKAWTDCALELQEEGVRAIVGGCGLTGMIQTQIASAVEIPVFTSSMLYVKEMHETVANHKRVGILTVSKAQLLAHDGVLLRECGIEESIPIAIAGMNESADAEVWLTMTTPSYDKEAVERAVVNTALQLRADYPDLGAYVLECTDMPPYSDAIRAATGLPVFDPVDMINRVHKTVTE